MSHSVVITRTTTTSTGNPHVALNSSYLRTTAGLLKLAQLIIGAANVGILVWYVSRLSSVYATGNPELFFLLMAVSFLIGTFCLLASCLVSLSTGGIISQTIYELVFHTTAFLLCLTASIILLVDVTNGRYYGTFRVALMVASILGIIVSVLYLLSALRAQRSYRGI